jgi:uncharacterized membrane protein YdjX (TVP38/TMEM64 family)
MPVNRLRAALPLLLLLTTGLVLFFAGMGDHLSLARLARDHADLVMAVRMHPWLSRIAYVGLLTLVTSTGVPGSLIVIVAGGLVFGEIEGVLLSSIGLLLGSLLLFLAGRYAFGGGHKPAPRLVERLRHGYAAHPVNYTFFLRFVPVFPFGAISVALAWLRCPMWLFLLATFLGGSTMLIFETAIGADLGHSMKHGAELGWHMLFSQQLLLPLTALALLALLPLAMHRRQQRKRD